MGDQVFCANQVLAGVARMGSAPEVPSRFFLLVEDPSGNCEGAGGPGAFVNSFIFRAPPGATNKSSTFDQKYENGAAPFVPHPLPASYPVEYSYTLNGQQVAFKVHGWKHNSGGGQECNLGFPPKADITVTSWGPVAGLDLFYACMGYITNPACPRVDAWIDGEWQEVGKAIRFNDGKDKDRLYTIKLKTPAQKFRVVEDEPEVSYIHRITGDDMDWRRGELVTKQDEIYEFEFVRPVSVLKTYGYYEVLVTA